MRSVLLLLKARPGGKGGCRQTRAHQTRFTSEEDASMAKHTFLVLTNPVEGRDADYNDWYTNQHIPDVVSVPGIVAAQRFKLNDFQMAGAPSPWKYLAIYEIETDDLKATFDAMQARIGTDQMVMTDALDMEKLGTFVFTPITKMTTTEEVARSRRKAS
jgi:hypothetical protein